MILDLRLILRGLLLSASVRVPFRAEVEIADVITCFRGGLRSSRESFDYIMINKWLLWEILRSFLLLPPVFTWDHHGLGGASLISLHNLRGALPRPVPLPLGTINANVPGGPLVASMYISLIGVDVRMIQKQLYDSIVSFTRWVYQYTMRWFDIKVAR
jgi:hypothetical protein